MQEKSAQFRVGQIIHHKRFGYRGVIVDVDPFFKGSESWYHNATTTNPPKDQPWYHVLVDREGYTTYVAERNLEAHENMDPIEHPELARHFDSLRDGLYIPRTASH